MRHTQKKQISETYVVSFRLFNRHRSGISSKLFRKSINANAPLMIRVFPQQTQVLELVGWFVGVVDVVASTHCVIKSCVGKCLCLFIFIALRNLLIFTHHPPPSTDSYLGISWQRDSHLERKLLKLSPFVNSY